MLIEIKHRFTASVLFSLECESLKICVEAAVKVRANLGGANLSWANLSGANLNGANLNGAYLVGANLGGANLNGANLNGVYLVGANLGGADLRVANLGGADLRVANLGGANLGGADLRGAKYGDDVPLTKAPIQILGSKWPVFIFDLHIMIGCQLHSTTEWEAFDDDQISNMATGAFDWWKEWKVVVLSAAKAHQRREE